MFTPKRILTYILNGGVTTSSQFLTLFIMVEFLSVRPLQASVLAFVVSLCVGFTLHRFVTFAVKQKDGIATHFVLVASMAVTNLLVNTSAMYVLLKLNMHYLIAQFFVTGTIVIWTYVGYNYIFRVNGSST